MSLVVKKQVVVAVEPKRPGYDRHMGRLRECQKHVMRLRVLPPTSLEAAALREKIEAFVPLGIYKGVNHDCSETLTYEVVELIFSRQASTATTLEIMPLEDVVKVMYRFLDGVEKGTEIPVSILDFLKPCARDGYWGARFWLPGTQPDVAVPKGRIPSCI